MIRARKLLQFGHRDEDARSDPTRSNLFIGHKVIQGPRADGELPFHRRANGGFLNPRPALGASSPGIKLLSSRFAPLPRTILALLASVQYRFAMASHAEMR
jgi:hypothetical protein